MWNGLAALSALLCAATSTCWLIGAVQDRQVRAWRFYGNPGHSCFARLDRQHLIISEQRMVPEQLPAHCAVDTTRFRHWVFKNPEFSDIDMDQDAGDGVLNPTGAAFRVFRVQSTNITVHSPVTVTVRGYYGAAEIPWWSLLIVFSVWPALWLAARHRVLARRKRGHCPGCGYDLRATPERCPECGTVPTANDDIG
jgi:hypothetical protein